jgi:DNA replicative helicase MCM subunit Mcm2 (Cdc46/Mcm family)
LESSSRCGGTNLQIVPGGSVHTDYQEVKIQETCAGHMGSSANAGHIPRSLLVKLQHDLVDAVRRAVASPCCVRDASLLTQSLRSRSLYLSVY